MIGLLYKGNENKMCLSLVSSYLLCYHVLKGLALGGRKGKGRAPNWIDFHDGKLLELSMNQYDKNNISDGTFKPQAWNECVPIFNARIGLDYGRDQLYNRWKTLKKLYSLYDQLLRKSGWGLGSNDPHVDAWI